MDLKRDLERLRLADQGAKQSASQERVRVHTVTVNGHNSPSTPVRCSSKLDIRWMMTRVPSLHSSPALFPAVAFSCRHYRCCIPTIGNRLHAAIGNILLRCRLSLLCVDASSLILGCCCNTHSLVPQNEVMPVEDIQGWSYSDSVADEATSKFKEQHEQAQRELAETKVI